MQQTELIPIQDAAHEAGVSLRTLQTWIARDQTPTFIRGDRRRRYVRRSDLDRLMQPRPVQLTERATVRV